MFCLQVASTVNSTRMNRKDFLLSSALAAFSISAFGRATRVNDAFEGDCATTNDILGPFYRPDAPTRQNLLYDTETGSAVEINGMVCGPDCTTPIENALVEIWHCNTDGAYDNESNDFHHRAKWFTNKKGNYSFKTILPGKYLNGGQYRPAHVHFRVTAPGHKELVSQLYFQGDPHIAIDPWASQKKAAHRILPIALQDTRGNLAVTFDIYLESA